MLLIMKLLNKNPIHTRVVGTGAAMERFVV